MRYQFKWQDVSPQEIPPRRPGQPRGMYPSRAGAGHQSHRDRARLRHVRNATRRLLPKLPRDKIIVQTKVAPQATPAEFLKIFDRSHGLSEAGSCGSAFFARHQQPPVAGLVAEEKRLPRRRPEIAKAGPRAASSDFPPMPPRISSWRRSTPGNSITSISTGISSIDLNWSAVQAARRQDMGVFIISPNDKGGKLDEPPPKIKSTCARRSRRCSSTISIAWTARRSTP